jgi:hypothetical protein
LLLLFGIESLNQFALFSAITPFFAISSNFFFSFEDEIDLLEEDEFERSDKMKGAI